MATYSIASLPVQSVFCISTLIATSTTAIYTLSLHDALPIFPLRDTAGSDGAVTGDRHGDVVEMVRGVPDVAASAVDGDRKSTRLNSSHVAISYAVFCLKKKKI